ncbi:MAG: purine-nucleoside phosphorylase [Peptococcaceae bacterium]|nr:purine-nucleoside phosphorylase [Peptococcaceae bacterium]
MSTINHRIENAFAYIRSQSKSAPKIGLILGSGLGEFISKLDTTARIQYQEIPGFPISTVEGHEGAFVFGDYEGIPMVVQSGRFHYYEGYTQQEVAMPVRIMKKLGVEALVITNAAGGINLAFSEGALMLITDHINYSGDNPLRGANLDEFGPRFPDVSDIYTKDLRLQLKDSAEQSGIALDEGIYIMNSGPSFETAAEIRFFRAIGADAVGMSTVPEALTAAHCGMKVVGISCITNMATGILEKKLDHKEVIATTGRVKDEFSKLICLAIKMIHAHNCHPKS